MKVIFLKDVRGVGRRNEVKDVADGFARNFLLANKSAEIASPDNLAKLKHRQAEIGRRGDLNKSQIQELFKKLNGTEHKLNVTANAKGVLFAAVSKEQIASLIGIDPNLIVLAHPIKDLGVHEIELAEGEYKSKLKLHLQSKDA